MKSEELNIEEIRNKSIHEDLFKVLCLLKQARNTIHKVKSEKGLEEHFEKLDHAQADLNDVANWINEIIADVMYDRVDDLV